MSASREVSEWSWPDSLDNMGRRRNSHRQKSNSSTTPAKPPPDSAGVLDAQPSPIDFWPSVNSDKRRGGSGTDGFVGRWRLGRRESRRTTAEAFSSKT
jgi:hypothetical protein